MSPRTLLISLLLLLMLPATALAADPVPVLPSAESAPNFEDESADADDPAIWVNPVVPSRSVVVGTLKDAGLTAFDLDGNTLQKIAAPPAPGADAAIGRFNNVDVVYKAKVGHSYRDLAIVSDRGQDQVRTYAIDPLAATFGKAPLRDVSAKKLPFVFNETQDEVNEQATTYGLAAWVDPRSHDAYVVVSRRSRTGLALLKLVAGKDGKVSYKKVDSLSLPSTFKLSNGDTWTACATEPGEGPQVEGMTIDPGPTTLWAAQEDVGIWKIGVSTHGFTTKPALIEKVREFGAPYELVPDDDPGEFECEFTGDAPAGVGGEHISADVEGLTVYHGPKRTGYLLASSQGDDTFSAFDDRGDGPYVGTFEVAESDGVDSVQESDGATLVEVPLGKRFPQGLFVTHDGDDEKAEDRDATNFKLVRLERVLNALTPPSLLGRAILPADATAPAPFAGIVDTDPAPAPGATQPIGGFSALVDAPGDDAFYAMPDNGFGSKANSRSFILRVYRVKPEFETARGGSGTVRIKDWISLRDPNHKVPFAIVNENTKDRLLTGGDFDVESFRVDRRGDLWFGEEFGPFLLHTDATGKVLEKPIPLPDVKSPSYPADYPAPFAGDPNLANSNGFEGMAISADGKKLYPTLEGPVTGDDPTTRRMYEFDLRTRQYTSTRHTYRIETGMLVSDLTVLDGDKLIALERDNFEGPAAAHKRGFVIDLNETEADSTLRKQQVIDLTSLADPTGISLPARVGDIGLGNPFVMPYQTIEAVLPLGDDKLAIVNDTNFGSKGRNPSLPDYGDFIVVRAPLLDQE